MQIEIFTLCDNAQVYAGKAVITGAFNRIVAKQLPFHINLTLAVRATFEQAENGDKKFEFNFKKPDGTPLLESFTLEAKQNGKPDTLGTFDLNVALGNIEIKQCGLYSVIMNIDGKEYVSKFLVKQG